jgi:outer membrane murein-binding lipoprotein Lpp
MKSPLRIVVLALSAVLVAGLSHAQSNQTGDSEKIQQLLLRIDQLEASQKSMQEKIDSLQAAKPASKAAPEPAPEPVAEQPQAHVLGPVEFHRFSDFDYANAWFEKLPPAGLKGSTKSFNIGDFDLFTNTRLSDHWSMLGELLVSSDLSNEFGAEMDRLPLTYKRNQYFKISFGKYATSLGYYTNEFHRAQYFQTGVGRPIMYADEDNGGILPTHNIGVTATGLIPSGNLDRTGMRIRTGLLLFAADGSQGCTNLHAAADRIGKEEWCRRELIHPSANAQTPQRLHRSSGRTLRGLQDDKSSAYRFLERLRGRILWRGSGGRTCARLQARPL